MIYNDNSRENNPILAAMSNQTWNYVFKGKEVSDFIHSNIMEMIEEKKTIGWLFNLTSFSEQDMWLAVHDYHQLSPQEWREMAEVFSVPNYWQEYIAILSGNLAYLNTYFFNDAEAFEKSFKEYDYQILRFAAEYNHFNIVNRLLEMYAKDLPEIFKKRGEDIIRFAIDFGHAELVASYLKIYPDGRLQAFLRALSMSRENILQQFTAEEINAWIEDHADQIYRNAYLSGNVRLFDKILGFFSEKQQEALIQKYLYDALYRSVVSNQMDMLIKIDSLATDELRSKILHIYSCKDLFESAVRTGNIQVCDWVRAIKIKDEDVFLGMNCLRTAQSEHNLDMVNYLMQYAESSGKLKEFLAYAGYQSLSMGAYYGDVDIFERVISKVEPEDFRHFIREGLGRDIFYSALAQGHEEIADRIEHYAKQYGCWEDVKEQNILADINELMKQSPHVIQRFLETTNHLEKIDYREISSFLSDKWQAFCQNPSLFLSHHSHQIDAVMQFAIKTHQAISCDLLKVLDITPYKKAWIDIALHADNEDFIVSYLRLPGMFDEIYANKTSHIKDYLIKAQAEECLTVEGRMAMVNTLQEALGKMRMNYDIHLEDSPILSLKLTLHFNNAYERTLFNTYMGLPGPEQVEYPYQQTIDIYRHHGQVDVQNLSENLNRIQAQWGVGNSDPGPLLLSSIYASIDSNESSNIAAFIKTTQRNEDYFCFSIKNPSLMSTYEKEYLDRLLILFPLLCEKNGIKKIKEDWLTVRKHPASQTHYYEFNIRADDFHELMLKESDFYRGYRNTIYSVYQLAHPETQYYKPETMCLFPIQPLENEMMLRNAGCNVSEVLSVQLSSLIQQLSDEYEALSIGGHHESEILTKFGINGRELLAAALKCAGASDDYIATHNFHEAFDGFNILPLIEEEKKQCVKEIDATNLPIYGVSANLKSELYTLKSFEVPMETYLATLQTICKDKQDVVDHLQELIEKMQASHGSKLGR